MLPPTLYTPPPVPATWPGPSPPPVPEPIPVPSPVPIPPPNPGPCEGGPGTPSGSPRLLAAICGSLSSGGPSRVGVTGRIGLILGTVTSGGAIWTFANSGALPFEGGVGVRAPPPPPPPALLAGGGSCGRYGEMSTTSTLAACTGCSHWLM